jgi:hypothetical protein
MQKIFFTRQTRQGMRSLASHTLVCEGVKRRTVTFFTYEELVLKARSPGFP